MGTKIEWTHGLGYKGETWNPIVGCTKVSPGCQHCYAERMAKRLKAMGVVKYQDVVDENGWTGRIAYAGESAFIKPYKWKKPRMVFVCSMSDVFHETLSDAIIDWIMDVVIECPQHTFQILTKRAKRMAEYFSTRKVPDNCWVGVTCENQAMADERIPHLLGINAPVRFVSVEPMLGPVDLRKYLQSGSDGFPHEQEQQHDWLDWVICGGESGPGARPMHPDWARGLRDQCQAAGVPFFFKQWGEWAPDCLCKTKEAHKEIDRPSPGIRGVMFHCGKKNAGRELDGRTWDEFPENLPRQAMPATPSDTEGASEEE